MSEHGWDVTGAPERPGGNRGLIAAVVVTVLVLAVVGATAGWILADRSGSDPAGRGVTPVPSGTTPSAPPTQDTTSEPDPTPAATAIGGTATGNPGDSFRLPDVSGKDFVQARRELRELRLGVTVVFGSSGEDHTVARTEPVAGVRVRRGLVIKLYVRGAAPYATIPGIVGVPCNQGGSIAADHGLVPQYPTGRTGVVLRTDPEQANDRLRWNEVLKIYCGAAPSSPSG